MPRSVSGRACWPEVAAMLGLFFRQQKLQESKEELQVLIEEKGHLEQVRCTAAPRGGETSQVSEAIHGPKKKLKAMVFRFPSFGSAPESLNDSNNFQHFLAFALFCLLGAQSTMALAPSAHYVFVEPSRRESAHKTLKYIANEDEQPVQLVKLTFALDRNKTMQARLNFQPCLQVSRKHQVNAF